MTADHFLRYVFSQLLLSLSKDKVKFPDVIPQKFQSITEPVILIAGGNSPKLIKENYYPLILSENCKQILDQFPMKDLHSVLEEFISKLVSNVANEFRDEQLASVHLQLIAIAFLQTYIQLNFTGPSIDFSSRDFFFPNVDEKFLQLEALKSLNIEGQQAYDLMADPLFLIIPLLIFEKLIGLDAKYSLINQDKELTVEDLTNSTMAVLSDSENDPIKASIYWWRCRALQTHLSILSEPASILSSISSLLLKPSVVKSLTPLSNSELELQKHVQLIYFLESARIGIHSSTEHLSIPFLSNALKLSELSFVISGAKAKRTKFQTFHTSALVVLAKSKTSSLYEMDDCLDKPESFELDSDLLLERVQYESLDDLDIPDEQNSKRIKLDNFDSEGVEDKSEKLLPIAMRQEEIPEELKSLDPNNQPGLNGLDNLQLLLRLTILKQTSPSNDPMVNEELLALVNRILHSNSKSVNWTVFSRALWERSILETTKSRTIERGILQMTSLVEESNIKVKSKIIPQAKSEEDESPVSSRLRFIHQLPLIPHWTMDAKLAEKYMSLGVFHSAVQIYERLNLACEAALCYAAVENEAEAERILVDRIKLHPEDARAISILGDIKQDPNLWLKAWEIGKYAKAKSSLSRYYYSPPQNANVNKNIDLAIMHMNDCLNRNPINYEYWFFYGCLGLESGQFELASEAFTRCVSLDDSNSHAWSNLSSALLKLDKTKPAFNALKKAIRSAGEGKKSWRIYENYLIVAAKLNEWNDVLLAVRELIDIRGSSNGEASIDIPVIEKLVEILISTQFPETGTRFTHYQTSCIDLVCNILPSVITSSARCWRIVAKVELWRKKPWVALECHEKAYRAVSQRAELETDESAWNDAVDSCSDLVAAYESLGELPGKHNAGDVVCKDWKYKARTSIRSLISKGKAMWEDSEGWDRLQTMKEHLSNNVF